MLPFPVILPVILWGLFYTLNIPNLRIHSFIVPYFQLIVYLLFNKKIKQLRKIL